MTNIKIFEYVNATKNGIKNRKIWDIKLNHTKMSSHLIIIDWLDSNNHDLTHDSAQIIWRLHTSLYIFSKEIVTRIVTDVSIRWWFSSYLADVVYNMISYSCFIWIGFYLFLWHATYYKLWNDNLWVWIYW